MSSDQVLTEDDVAEELQYFKELPTRYTDPKLKADVKLRYVGYYNVAKIYLYLDMPDKVAEYANLLFENGHDKGDAKKLNEDADKLKALFDSSEIKARHFSTDPYFTE
jgi:predicted ATP-binding protein involved in virulence